MVGRQFALDTLILWTYSFFFNYTLLMISSGSLINIVYYYSALQMNPLFPQVLTDVLIPATMQEMPERFVTYISPHVHFFNIIVKISCDKN